MAGTSIAIVGMSGRFPGAKDIRQFWRNLRDGVESIRRLSNEELLAAGVRPEDLSNPDYVKAAPILDDVDQFDAPFFGFSPRDASIMDPQHRHFLECAWEALENAGHPPDQFPGSVAVYAGSGLNTYLIYNLLTNQKLMESAGLFLLKQTGNDKDVLATRVSYQLNLRGPSINVQTACSTSLVAVHLASQALLNHECDMALAGGVTIEIPHGHGYMYREGEILSRDGHCRSFDASSSGTVFSSGAGVVVLRRLEDAIADRDTIHAVILSSAINNDGARKVGFLAPSVEGQAEVISEALGVAGIFADSISYVETHGTGTAVGDPIEIKALTKAFRGTTQRKNFCAVGSLKSSVGHLDAAAGVAGLIKTALALENKKIPASLHFEKPNPMIDFAASPFFVNAKLSDWPAGNAPRRAGVTSLGIGGTNAHVILEEAPELPPSEGKKPFQLLTVSAKTETALQNSCSNLASFFEENPMLRMADVAFTLQAGRKGFPLRRAFVVSDSQHAIRALSGREPRQPVSGKVAGDSPSVVFLFSGQGSQYVGMCRGLYESEPVFRENLDRCASALLPLLQVDLRNVLFATGSDADAAREKLNQTWLTQPALFSVEYSLAQWWKSVGISPKAMVGHSIGEYVAACLAGVMSLEDALAITVLRGRLMQDLPGGAMLAVPVSPDQLTIPDGLSLAAVNSPDQCVVSGPYDLIDQFEQALQHRGIAGRRLHTSHAFHSAMMDPILDAFTSRLRQVRLRGPQIPFVSNVTADWITAEQATDPSYWAKHLRNAVRFADCIAKIYEKPGNVLMEVGPGNVLTSLARQHPAKNAPVFASTRSAHDSSHDSAILLSAVGNLWALGHQINWKALHAGETVGRIPLPAYPFDHQRYWIEGGAPLHLASEKKSGPMKAASGLFYFRSAWKEQGAKTTSSPGPTTWLLLQESTPLASAVRKRLTSEGKSIIEVSVGDSYKRIGPGKYRVRIKHREDFETVVADLVQNNSVPSQILDLLPLGIASMSLNSEDSLQRSFHSLLYISQALAERDLSGVEITVVSDRMQAVGDSPVSYPLQAPLLGPVRVVPKEFPGITCRSVDLDLGALSPSDAAKLLLDECSAASPDPVIAYRQSKRYVESVEPVELPDSSSGKLKKNGVYLITGGVGGIGLVLAEHLARTVQAKLVLLSRSFAATPEEWVSTAASSAVSERDRHRARKLLEIESLGSEILICRADVCDAKDLQAAISEAKTRFGKIDGVLHAAGVLEDAPFQLKTSESANRVLAPKIDGTRNLESILAGENLDFLMLFSSVSSLLPPAGQVDYAAANAFLDAFVASNPRVPVVAVNWGLWKDVGMGEASPSMVHPLLNRRSLDQGDSIEYASQFTCSSHWLLKEHAFKNGTALVPGTGYLEMAVAGMGPFVGGLELRDVFFLAPLAVGPEESRQVRLTLKKEGASYQFSVFSHETDWRECATGQIARIQPPPPEKLDIARLLKECSVRETHFDDQHRTFQENFLDFGPRWRNLQSIRFGENQAISTLELAKEFHSDLNSYRIHPALLDLATGSALYLIDGYASADHLYLPISYKRILIRGQLPGRIYSYIRPSRQNRASDDIVAFDILVLDEFGSPLIEIEEFSFRKIVNPSALAPEIDTARLSGSAYTNPIPEPIRVGISAETGAKAFGAILSAAAPVRIIATAADFQAQWQLEHSSRIASPASHASSAAPDDRSREAVEAQLTAIWRELLGVEQISPKDNFFDLGGHSLLAARLSAKVKKMWDVSLPLATLFQAPTIESLASVLSSKSEPKGSPRVAAIKPDGHRPPFLCVDAGPFFRPLAQRLNPEQPFLGLRLADTSSLPLHYSMADIAAYHIQTIREIQPEGPYYLGGWSAGGLVAFEVAQQLTSQGEEVPLLVLFDVVNWNGLDRSTLWRKIGARVYLVAWKMKRHALALLTLRGEELRTHLRDSMKQLRVECNRVMWMIADRLKSRSKAEAKPAKSPDASEAVYVAARRYFPKSYPGRATLFRCEVQPMGLYCDSQLGWSGLLRDGLKIVEMAGDHDDMFQLPHVDLLARELDRTMDDALAQQKTPQPVAAVD